jgi:hypothetical protein
MVSSLLGLADLLLVQTESPPWANVNFVFSINFGTADPIEVESFRALKWIYDDPNEFTLRNMLLFIAPSLAETFYNALFSPSPLARLSDKPLGFPIEAQPLLWTFRFATSCIYDWDYSSKVLGTKTRPPLAAVIMDMAELAKYLSSPPTPPEPLSTIFSRFVTERRLKSVDFDNTLLGNAELKKGCISYVADLFKIISCCNIGFTEKSIWNKLDGWNFRLRAAEDGVPKWAKDITFPGPQYLVFGGRRWPLKEPEELDTPLDEMDANFICSGPYKLTFASRVEEHLTFNDKREIRLYCGGKRGLPIFTLLQDHRLRESLPI